MILKKRAGVFFVVAGLMLAGTGAAIAGAEPAAPSPSCDPTLAALFTPRHPRLGRYDACADPRPLAAVAPAGWTVQTLDPLDAFGAPGTYDRSAIARLYGGVRARVARGWTQTADGFESLTFISPHPNAALTGLEPGTLVIRWICDGGHAQC